MDVNVTPDFDVEAVPLREYYQSLNARLRELQELMGSSSNMAMPSNYEKYMHGDIPVGAVGNPLVTAKEYYEQLKQLRADSQVRRRARAGGRAAVLPGAAWPAGPARPSSVYPQAPPHFVLAG